MSKLDELRRAAGANVAESMSKGLVRPGATHGASAPAATGPDRWAGLERLPGAQLIPIDRIVRDPAQPREDFESPEAVAALAELTESVRARGVQSPIAVRWDEGQGVYVVIAGERRLRASRAAGRPSVPCVVRDGPLTAAELLLDQLAENLIRLDLQPIEQARAFKRAMDGNGWSARRLAEELHIDHDKVSRALSLIRLPEDVQEKVADGTIPPSTAAVIARVPDAATQRELAQEVVNEGLSRDQAVERVREVAERPAAAQPKAARKGRGASKAKPSKPRTFARLRAGKVIVEPREPGPEGIRAALAEAMAVVDVEIEAKGRGEAA
jgi:ParB family transcriptional regulator, chromosome partitioning protein